LLRTSIGRPIGRLFAFLRLRGFFGGKAYRRQSSKGLAMRFLLLSAVLLATVLPASAAAEDQSLAKALNAAKIMPAGNRFTAKQIGNEVRVGCYARNQRDKDVKIDAVLIAKLVIEKRPNVTKVRTTFFNTDLSYREVTVTASDIAAFGLGGISKDKFLETLEVVRVAGKSKLPDGASTTFNKDGIEFSYPKDWVFAAKDDNSYIGELSIHGVQQWANVLVRKQAAQAPAEQAGYDESFLTRSNGWKLVRKGAVTIGNAQGYELTLEQNGRLQQHLYVGPPGHIYSLTLQCDNKDAKQLAPVFAQVLNSVSAR
jgi:hypothetical protein